MNENAKTIKPGTPYRLNANKMKFYALAKCFFPEIEPMRRTEYTKYFRVRDYALNFRSGDYYHELFLSVCGGKPILCDDWHTYDEDGEKVKGWETLPLKADDLLELGILEEVKESA